MEQDTYLLARRRLPIVFLLAGLFVFSFIFPSTPMYGVIVCPLRAVTGIDCPGCGMGRSFCAISEGNFMHSLFHHPLGLLTYVTFLVIMMRNLGEWLLQRRFKPLLPPRPRRVAIWLALGLLLLAWIGRLTSLIPSS